MEDQTPIETWNVLVADDEEDVHQVTQLALKRATWRGTPIALTSVKSAREARDVLSQRRDFHVALVDVVMETEDAGLQLCRFIRDHCPRSLRIVVRTGQPGVAPPEVVLNEYDIDYYLAKPEVTVERLYSVVRACLRSSQDISTLLAFGKQIQNFTMALQSVTTLSDLLVFMGEGLRFLELKHSVNTLFFHDLREGGEIHPGAHTETGSGKVLSLHRDAIRSALAKGHDSGRKELEVIAGRELGLPQESSFVLLLTARVGGADRKGHEMPAAPKPAEPDVVRGGLFVVPRKNSYAARNPGEFCADARLFLENWRIAYAALRLQERVAREQMLREKMYFERMNGIAQMVAGVAHEINTPLGVANTANSTIVSRINTLVNDKPTNEDELKELFEDLELASNLLTKNLQRANQLISSFKKLSASQLTDERSTVDLGILLNDCAQTMSPETKKKKIQIKVERTPGTPYTWDGYPSHLTQVIVNFIQNAIRYAYHERPEGGVVDLRLSSGPIDGKPHFRIEFEDYGNGVAPHVLGRMFQPFVTTGRDRGGTGLGLAIVHNIVTNLLCGRISCTSVQGKGAKFVIEVPTKVPEKQGESDGAEQAAP